MNNQWSRGFWLGVLAANLGWVLATLAYKAWLS